LTAARLICIAATVQLGSCVEHDCSLDHAVDELVGTTKYVDCGRFDASYSGDAPHRAAHDCVVAAYAQEQAFTVRWYTPGIEGLQRHAYAGVSRGGRYQVTELVQGYGTDTTVLPTTERSCTDLIDEGACVGPYRNLCLRCVFAGEHTCEP
jgi:hypothetical protein